MKKFLSFLLVVFFISSAHADEIKIPDLSNNNISIQGVKFSPLEDLGVCWGSDGSVWKSGDGISWIPAAFLCFSNLKNVEPIDAETFFVATSTNILRSLNGSSVPEDISAKFPVNTIFEKVVYTNESVYVLAAEGKMFRSIDRGENWSDITISSPCLLKSVDFFRYVDTGYMIAGDQSTPLWRTTNGGMTWMSESLPQNSIGSFLTISRNFVFIAGVGDLGLEKPCPLVLRIYENGWEVMPLPESYIPCGLAFKNNVGVMLARKSSSLIGKTTNFGLSWQFEEKQTARYSLALTNSFIYTTGDSGTIYRDPLSITSITQYSFGTLEYSLSQNYPNPFNPVTKIKFTIPQQGVVECKVFDLLGKEVMTLINESMTSGSYEIDFDGTNLPSGTYFYRLEAGKFVETKKMILVK